MLFLLFFNDVFTDQIGSAIPKMCWDASHQHSLGGGDFWVTGYQGMMDAISAALYNTTSTTSTAGASTASTDATSITAAASNDKLAIATTTSTPTATSAATSAAAAIATGAALAATSATSAAQGYPMVTEDNAEPYMGMVQGFLTLNAFKLSLAQANSPDLPATGRMSPAFPMVRFSYIVHFFQ